MTFWWGVLLLASLGGAVALAEECRPSFETVWPDVYGGPLVTIESTRAPVWTYSFAFASPARCQEAVALVQTVLTRRQILDVRITTLGCN